MPAAEKAAYQRIFEQLHLLNRRRKADGKPLLSIGTVHAYVLAPDGEPLDSLHVAEARPKRMIAMLENATRSLKVPRGRPAVKPRPQSLPPRAEADALVLHLTARYLVPRNQPGARKEVDGAYVPAAPELGTERAGSWAALPSEDWVQLEKAQWRKLLPVGAVEVGSSWDVDQEVAAQLLTRCYPTTENNDLTTNRIDRQALKATVVSIQGGMVRARLEGHLKMKHTFYPRRDDDNVVEATLEGYLDFPTDRSRIDALRLVTARATYGGPSRHFGVAVRSVASHSEEGGRCHKGIEPEPDNPRRLAGGP